MTLEPTSGTMKEHEVSRCSFCKKAEVKGPARFAPFGLCKECVSAQVRMFGGAAIGVLVTLCLFDRWSYNTVFVGAVEGAWLETGVSAIIRERVSLRGRFGPGYTIVAGKARFVGLLIVATCLATAAGLCVAFPDHLRWR